MFFQYSYIEFALHNILCTLQKNSLSFVRQFVAVNFYFVHIWNENSSFIKRTDVIQLKKKFCIKKKKNLTSLLQFFLVWNPSLPSYNFINSFTRCITTLKNFFHSSNIYILFEISQFVTSCVKALTQSRIQIYQYLTIHLSNYWQVNKLCALKKSIKMLLKWFKFESRVKVLGYLVFYFLVWPTNGLIFFHQVYNIVVPGNILLAWEISNTYSLV